TISLNIKELKINSKEVFGLGKESEIGAAEESDEPFSREHAAGKLILIDNALKSVAGRRATLGTKQNRLLSSVNNMSISIENAESAKSHIKDVDFTGETANFTQQRILGQSGISVLSQANSHPKMVLALLR